jgi:hypothetical protein
VNGFKQIIPFSRTSPACPKTPSTTNKSGWFCLLHTPYNAPLSKLTPKTTPFPERNFTTKQRKSVVTPQKEFPQQQQPL